MTTPSKSERTRVRILDAASRLFAASSFDRVSIRAIAREAGVDSALVHHYFGTKDDLFTEVLSHAATPAELLGKVAARPADDWGAELLRTGLRLLESPAGPALRAMLRSGISSHPALLRTFVEGQLMSRIGGMLSVPEEERRRRAVLVGSQFVGLFVARYVVRIEPLASMAPEEIVTAIGPTIQRYLTGDISGG